MVDCKLGYLKTEFSPERIILIIEMVPLECQEFDQPMDNVVSKLDQVANYARETFGVRTAPVSTKEPGSPGHPSPPGKAERKQKEIAKMLKGGAGRAIKVMEQELARAKAEKNPAAIKSAEEQLARAQAMAKK